MVRKIRDKEIEYIRYNKKAEEKLKGLNIELSTFQDASHPDYLMTPYIYYEEQLVHFVRPKMEVLDLCCGDGIHTISIAKLLAKVTALDISENSIEIGKMRALIAGLDNIEFFVGDAEKFYFGEQKYDIITCVGSLSYLDLSLFITQVKKHLKPDGKLICLDSLDHNCIYRINRFVHFLLNQRSWSTLVRMPNMKTLAYLKQEFNDVDIQFFGIFCFLGPICSKLFGKASAKIIIDNLDQYFKYLKKYSFKFVLIASNK